MGIDAIIYVTVPPDEPSAFEAKLRRWNYELGDAFHSGNSYPRLKVLRDGGHYGLDPRPPSGSVVMDLDFWGRYYGKGYERGPIVEILAILRWVTERIPDARAYYGGDSGETLYLYTKAMHDELWEHFVANGHRPYKQDSAGDGPECPNCAEKTYNCGGGGPNRARFWNCAGCPAAAVEEQGHVEWLLAGEQHTTMDELMRQREAHATLDPLRPRQRLVP